MVTDTGYKMQFTQDIIFNSMNRDSKIGILEAWMPTTETHNSRRASKWANYSCWRPANHSGAWCFTRWRKTNRNVVFPFGSDYFSCLFDYFPYLSNNWRRSAKVHGGFINTILSLKPKQSIWVNRMRDLVNFGLCKDPKVWVSIPHLSNSSEYLKECSETRSKLSTIFHNYSSIFWHTTRTDRFIGNFYKTTKTKLGILRYNQRNEDLCNASLNFRR